MYIEKNCKICDKLFQARKSDDNRGRALYCSIKCAGRSKNLKALPLLYERTCVNCSLIYQTASKYSKICSKACRLRKYRADQNKNSEGHIKTFYKVFKDIPCEICNWKETSRDLHHIIEVSNGGTNVLSNLISVCPNHHRMIHNQLISIEQLTDIIKNRTWNIT